MAYPRARRKVEELALSNPRARASAVLDQVIDWRGPDGAPILGPDDVPSLRVVQGWIAAIRRRGGDAWSLAVANQDDAPFLLEVLWYVVEAGYGRPALTTDEAAWCVRVHRASPGLHPWDAFVVGRLYLARIAGDESTVGLDTYLAFRTWESPENRDQYLRKAREGGWAEETWGAYASGPGWRGWIVRDVAAAVAAWEYELANNVRIIPEQVGEARTRIEAITVAAKSYEEALEVEGWSGSGPGSDPGRLHPPATPSAEASPSTTPASSGRSRPG